MKRKLVSRVREATNWKDQMHAPASVMENGQQHNLSVKVHIMILRTEVHV